MERFVIIVNGLQPLTIITKRSILDVAAALDPPLNTKGDLYDTVSRPYLKILFSTIYYRSDNFYLTFLFEAFETGCPSYRTKFSSDEGQNRMQRVSFVSDNQLFSTLYQDPIVSTKNCNY